MAYSLATHCPLVSTRANSQEMDMIWKNLKAEETGPWDQTSVISIALTSS